MPARGRFHALVEPPEHGARRGAGVARWSAAAMTEREAAYFLPAAGCPSGAAMGRRRYNCRSHWLVRASFARPTFRELCSSDVCALQHAACIVQAASCKAQPPKHEERGTAVSQSSRNCVGPRAG